MGVSIFFYAYYGCYLLEKDADVYGEMSSWFNEKIALNYIGFPWKDVEYSVQSRFGSGFEERLKIVDNTVIIETYDYESGF